MEQPQAIDNSRRAFPWMSPEASTKLQNFVLRITGASKKHWQKKTSQNLHAASQEHKPPSRLVWGAWKSLGILWGDCDRICVDQSGQSFMKIVTVLAPGHQQPTYGLDTSDFLIWNKLWCVYCEYLGKYWAVPRHQSEILAKLLKFVLISQLFLHESTEMCVKLCKNTQIIAICYLSEFPEVGSPVYVIVRVAILFNSTRMLYTVARNNCI